MLNQKLPSGGATPIEFKSDDPVTIFEIWRTDTKPTSWRDFNFHKRVDSSDFFSNPCKEASSASFTDNVAPNKKYWYTFRTIDAHDHTSNPTGVFQVEMVDTGNSIFPIIEMYPFPETPPSYTKPMKRYLKISPSSIQEAKNPDIENAQNFVDDPILAYGVDETMWGKQYKLRSRTEAIAHLLKYRNSFKGNGLDQNGEPI